MLNSRSSRTDNPRVSLERKAPVPQFIDKLRVAVRLVLLAEEPTAGSLSLAPHSERHAGPETLLERLNDRVRVLPFERASDDAIMLVTREHIEWVMPGADIEPALVRPPTFAFTREERVRARLLSGAFFDGVLAMEMPHEHNRASDFLNGEDDFFVLTSPSGTVLVNKSRVVDIHVYGARPRASVRAA